MAGRTSILPTSRHRCSRSCLRLCRSFGLKAIVAFGSGAIIGLLPCFIFAAIAPAQFRFDVFTYSLLAPAQWWDSVGRADMLEPLHRIARLLRFGGEGVIMIGLAAA